VRGGKRVLIGAYTASELYSPRARG